MKLENQDTYLIENSFNLMDPSPLFIIYQRLCGASAITLYGYLLSEGKSHETQSHETLCTALDTTLIKLNQDLECLQMSGLINIHAQHLGEGTNYLYTLSAPLTVAECLRHDVIGRLYLKSVGSTHFEHIRSRYGLSSLSKEGYEPVKAEVNKSFMQAWSAQEEAVFQTNDQPRHIADQLSFDIKAFQRECSPIVLPLKKRTEKAFREIREIGSVYGLSVHRMIELVGMAHVENDVELNTEKLRKLASREQITDYPELENPYDYPPVVFLKRLRNGLEATNLEKYVLNNLVSKVGLNPCVINVLTEANFKYYKSKLNTKALEETAMQWAVLNIRTQDEALAQLTKTFTPSKGRRVEMVSDYSKENTVELSEEEKAKIIESFKKLAE